jgi:uncharacterized protein YjbI with pentapeptide repeats
MGRRTINVPKSDPIREPSNDAPLNLPLQAGARILDRDLTCLSAAVEPFADIQFERVDLYGAHLEQASFFKRCHFADVVFTKALINGARFTDCIFLNCRFFRADMVGVRIIRCRFETCDFSGATMCSGFLEHVIFVDCLRDGSAICENDEINVGWLSQEGLP